MSIKKERHSRVSPFAVTLTANEFAHANITFSPSCARYPDSPSSSSAPSRRVFNNKLQLGGFNADSSRLQWRGRAGFSPASQTQELNIIVCKNRLNKSCSCLFNHKEQGLSIKAALQKGRPILKKRDLFSFLSHVWPRGRCLAPSGGSGGSGNPGCRPLQIRRLRHRSFPEQPGGF